MIIGLLLWGKVGNLDGNLPPIGNRRSEASDNPSDHPIGRLPISLRLSTGYQPALQLKGRGLRGFGYLIHVTFAGRHRQSKAESRPFAHLRVHPNAAVVSLNDTL